MTDLKIKCGCGTDYEPQARGEALSFVMGGRSACTCPDCGKTPAETSGTVVVA